MFASGPTHSVMSPALIISSEITSKRSKLHGDTLEARDLLQEGAEILQTGCIAHNHLWYWRDALEWALETVNLPLAGNYADHLETCIGGTPLPWAKLLERFPT